MVEVGSRRVLIDCGQRMGGGAEVDRLPDLQRVQELGGLDAILVTHAHADHIGALPLIHLAFPKVPLYTNEATLALMRIMLADSLKIMQLRWMQEAEIPLYPEHAVASMLARVEVVRPGDVFDLCAGELQASFLLSGHVLGACSLTLDTAEGRVFFTGDYSVDAQRTVDSIVVPAVRPHVVITEATYGNRLHANRKAEEMRLAEAVARVVGGGGKVLIPAFALGRAQEVLLILLSEMKAGRIAKFPIFVDGMVRNVCQIYSLFPEFLGDRLRKQVEREGNPFFQEGSAARAVAAGERESVPLGEPCCIVSSSGMLMGGPSQFYAAELAGDPKNAIWASIQCNNLKPIDLAAYYGLRSPIAKRLYRFLDKRRLNRNSFELELDSLAQVNIGLTSSTRVYPSQLKQSLNAPHRELEKIGFLSSFKYILGNNKAWRVRYNFQRQGSLQETPSAPALPKEKPVSQVTATPEEQALVQRGISNRIASTLVAEHADRLPDLLDFYDFVMTHRPGYWTNPVGWLVQAIREDYTIPKDFQD